MRSALGANEIFSPQKFLGDLVTGLASRNHAKFPSPDFHRALEFAVQRDLERFMNAKARELDALELAGYRHTVVTGWAFGGTTATQRQPPRIAESYWDSQCPRPDESDGLGQHFRFRKQPPLELSQAKARHMHEVVAARRVAAAGAAGA